MAENKATRDAKERIQKTFVEGGMKPAQAEAKARELAIKFDRAASEKKK